MADASRLKNSLRKRPAVTTVDVLGKTFTSSHNSFWVYLNDFNFSTLCAEMDWYWT